MQTRRQSLIEAGTNTVVGYIIAVLLTYFIMDSWGHTFTWSQSMQYVACFMAVSIIRGYLLRRLFNRLHSA